MEKTYIERMNAREFLVEQYKESRFGMMICPNCGKKYRLFNEDVKNLSFEDMLKKVHKDELKLSYGLCSIECGKKFLGVYFND